MDWYFDDDINPMDYQGFVYLITNLISGKKYIGRKYIWSKRKGKKAVESDWKTYYGSSKELLADIEAIGKDKFKREVLYWCKTRGECNYLETAEQWNRNVLLEDNEYGEPAYYNGHIGNYYARNVRKYQPINRDWSSR